jgi:hypothetical protein
VARSIAADAVARDSQCRPRKGPGSERRRPPAGAISWRYDACYDLPARSLRRRLRPPFQSRPPARRPGRQNPSRVSPNHQRGAPVSYVLSPDSSLTGRSSAPIKWSWRGPSQVRALRFGRFSRDYGEAKKANAEPKLTEEAGPRAREHRADRALCRKGRSHRRAALDAAADRVRTRGKKCSQSSKPAASNTASPLTT